MKTFTRIFAINLKCLHLFRILVGFIVLYDLYELISIYKFLVGSTGLVSTEMAAMEGQAYGVALAKIFFLVPPSIDLIFQNLVLCILGVGALFLIFGKFVRCAQLALMFCYLFLFWRWPQFTHDGDYLMIWIFLWISFLPIKTKFEDKYFYSYATVAFYLQILMFFTLAGMNKSGFRWFDGSAVGFALQQLNMTSWVGRQIVLDAGVSSFLTYFTLFSEIVAPLLLLITFRNYIFRKIGILLLTGTLVGIIVSFHTGNMAPAGLLLILLSISFPRKLEKVFVDPKPSFSSKMFISFLIFVGGISYLYNLDILPLNIRQNLASISIAAKIPLKQSWRMYSQNPPDRVVALRFFSEKNGQRTYRNFFNLDEVPAEKYTDTDSWYDLNIRYRRFQKYFERVYLKRGYFQNTQTSLNKSLCDRIGDAETRVGMDLWIKSIGSEVSYQVQPLSPDLFSCYTN